MRKVNQKLRSAILAIMVLPFLMLASACEQTTMPTGAEDALLSENSFIASPFDLQNSRLNGGVAAQLAEVRRHTAHFHNHENAEAVGYVNVNVDECVEHPELGGMGYHFVNFGLVDLELNSIEPEVLVYAPSPSGKLKLAAVEYAVPIAPWDEMHGEDNPPMVLGQQLHANPEIGLYVLHAWIWKHNPAGMFEDWNPKVSC